jgi:hypothetical protein
MGRGVLVLRCLADFLGARPALPAVTTLDVSWSIADRAWSVRAHLFGGTARDLAAWAFAIDDAVTTTEPMTSGAGMRMDVRGTVHGHPVHVWCVLDDGPGGGR